MTQADKIIEFTSDTAHRKQWFKGLSFSHPAKMHLSLQLYLIENYTKVGDVVIDVMAGSGTLLAACAIGRNVILVELEQKFVDMQKANWEKIKAQGAMLGYKMGTATILQGDSRKLPEVLADSCIFSPPYAEADQTGTNHGVMNKNRQDLIRYSYIKDQHGKTNGQIGNLPYGEISAIVSSPPYSEIFSKGHRSKLGNIKKQGSSYADVVISSPPYEQSLTDGHTKGRTDGTTMGYTDKADVICTSPPYEEAHDKKIGGLTDKNRPDLIPYSWTKTDSNDNIGNLKSENYLSAMFLVYRGCHRVLKDEGLLILVTKNFIRNKQIIRLDLDTIKLCEQAGFTLIERLKRKLTQQSFWRVIYAQKYPNAPKIEFEDILVFIKGTI